MTPSGDTDPSCPISKWADEHDKPTIYRALRVDLPEEVEPYRDDIRRFIDAMIYKLKVHAHKGRWEDKPIWERLDKLKGEVKELEQAIHGGNLIEIALEAADVGNYALIIMSIATERGK